MSRTAQDLSDSKGGQPPCPQALIPEARARQRRRQMVGLLIIASIIAALITSVLVVMTTSGPRGYRDAARSICP